MWYGLAEVMDPIEIAGISSHAIGMAEQQRKAYMASEIIRKLRLTGLPGPFEVSEVDDEEGHLTGQVRVRSHGKNNRDGWAI